MAGSAVGRTLQSLLSAHSGPCWGSWQGPLVVRCGLRSEQFCDAAGDFVGGFGQEGSVEMGVALGGFGGAVAQEFAGHEQRFAGHDGMRGVGVAQVVEPERWREPGLAFEPRPGRINVIAWFARITRAWEDEAGCGVARKTVDQRPGRIA